MDRGVSSATSNLIQALNARLAGIKEERYELRNHLEDSRSPSLKKWDAHIYALDGEIEVVGHTLSALEDELDLVRCLRRRAQNESTISYRVPDTILADIICAGQAMYDLPFRQNSFLQSITATCHHWRTVTLGTPLLWSNIHVRDGHFSPRAHVYLRRSRDAPLHIIMETRVDTHTILPLQNRRMQRWSKELQSHLSRCRALTVISRDTSVVREIVSLLDPATALRRYVWQDPEVDLISSGFTTPTEPPVALETSITAPTTVTITTRIRFNLASENHSFQGLKCLSLDVGNEESIRNALNCIAHFSTLIKLRLVLSSHDSEHMVTPLPQLRSPTLRILDVHLRSRGFQSLISEMQLPSLRHVIITSLANDSARDFNTTFGWLEFTSLETLWLPSSWWTAVALNNLLAACNDLRAVGCNVESVFDAMISLLYDFEALSPWGVHSPTFEYLYLCGIKSSSIHPLPTHRSPWNSRPHSPSPSPQTDDFELAYALHLLIQSHSPDQRTSATLKIHLNDTCWEDATKIPDVFNDLRAEFSENITLSGQDNDAIPSVFLPDWRTLSD